MLLLIMSGRLRVMKRKMMTTGKMIGMMEDFNTNARECLCHTAVRRARLLLREAW